ncbi:MAG: GMC family oxidoreductase [Planctomycetes bacterium]|nr:GMC family oxidoreductase [Planctomycetota bacterium]
MSADRRTEIAVVGSGAGGSVVAYHLAAAGRAVTVIERGPFVRASEMTHDEPAMIARLYKDGGAQTNNEADMFVLQGNCVGGSTVLTNAVCFRMPEDVRQSFGAHGFALPPDRLAAAYRRVESVLNVSLLPEDLHNPATRRLENGFRAIGREPGRFQKAMLHCVGCGFCNIGCRYGRKMDAAQTWIPMAMAHGARIDAGIEVRRIEHSRGRVRGLRCREVATGKEFVLRAERYVLAGGAINTPELLLRSGIHPSRAGKRTSFNAGAVAFGEFPEEVDGFDGDQMCVHYIEPRFGLEQIQNPPVSMALTLPGWGTDHAERMANYRRLAALGVLVPTRPTGEVFLGVGHRLLKRFFDHSDIRFRMGADEVAAFRDGLATAAAAMLAGGATRVFLPLAGVPPVTRFADLDELPRFLRDQKDLVGFGSSHPQGGAAAGNDARRDVVDPEFRVHGFENLFVSDASLFPHSIRVNPMLSVMAVADCAAEVIGGISMPDAIADGPVANARRAAVAAQ